MTFNKAVNLLLEINSDILFGDVEAVNKPTVTQQVKKVNQVDQTNRLKELLNQYNLQFKTTPRNIIVSAWVNLGLSKDEANKIVQNSLTKLPNVGNLDKSVRATADYKLKDELTVPMFLNLLKADDRVLYFFTNYIWSWVLEYAKENNISIANRDYNQLISLASTDSNIKNAVNFYREKFIEDMTQSDKIAGVRAAGSSLIVFYPHNITSVDHFMDALAHEALHTVQTKQDKNLYSPVYQSDYNKQNYDYLFKAQEIQAWAGMMKRLYYKKTGVIIDNNNLDKKFNDFIEFFKSYRSSDPNERSIFSTGRMYIDQYEKNPAGFNLKTILRDVAMNNTNSGKIRVA